MMKNNNQLFKTLHEDGLIGNGLYKIVTDHVESSSLSIIAGAALQASFDAYEKAKKTKLPLVMKEGDFLYKIKSDGSKKILKIFPKNINKLANTFISK
jgi:hypothetical protein